jgi:hypothetical protein
MAQIIATWNPPNYAFIRDYLVTLTQGVTLVDSQTIPFGTNRYESVPVTAGLTYTVCVAVRNSAGVRSDLVCVSLVADEDTVAAHAYVTPDLTNMDERYDWGTGQKYWVTAADSGDIVSGQFGSLLSTYTDPLLTYHSGVTSTIATEELDAGATYNTTWTGVMTGVNISGSSNKYLETRILASDAWVRNASPFTGIARRVRLSSEATGTATQRINSLGTVVVAAP